MSQKTTLGSRNTNTGYLASLYPNKKFTVAFPTTRGLPCIAKNTNLLSDFWFFFPQKEEYPPWICVLGTLLHPYFCSQIRTPSQCQHQHLQTSRYLDRDYKGSAFVAFKSVPPCFMVLIPTLLPFLRTSVPQASPSPPAWLMPPSVSHHSCPHVMSSKDPESPPLMCSLSRLQNGSVS